MKNHGGKRTGAGRPKTGRVKVGYTLKPETIGILKVLSKKEGLTIGEYIDMMTEGFFLSYSDDIEIKIPRLKAD